MSKYIIKEPMPQYGKDTARIVYIPDEVVKQIRADAIDEVSRAMYHQCFECDNGEDMQKWDSGNWFRYKLFENVIEQLKEQKK